LLLFKLPLMFVISFSHFNNLPYNLFFNNCVKLDNQYKLFININYHITQLKIKNCNNISTGLVWSCLKWIVLSTQSWIKQELLQDRSGSMTELVNASVVHSRDSGWNLDMYRKYFLICLCHIWIQICRVLTLEHFC
jgi:hypothetical protein